MTAAPIALFVYNRPMHTRQTIEALLRNELASDSELYIFCDGPKGAVPEPAMTELRRYVHGIRGFRNIHITEQPRNLGLSRSIIAGVTQLCEEYGRVIVLEDDLVTSPWFLRYMHDALQLYADNERVASIHGYCYPVTGPPLPETFFMRGGDCWGWATWSRAWRHFNPDGAHLLSELTRRGLLRAFDLDDSYGFAQMLRAQVAGKVDSWAVRWHAACFLDDLYTLYPGRSLVNNIGFDSSGRHSGTDTRFETVLATSAIQVRTIEVEQSARAAAAFGQFLKDLKPALVRRVTSAVARRLRASIPFQRELRK